MNLIPLVTLLMQILRTTIFHWYCSTSAAPETCSISGGVTSGVQRERVRCPFFLGFVSMFGQNQMLFEFCRGTIITHFENFAAFRPDWARFWRTWSVCCFACVKCVFGARIEKFYNFVSVDCGELNW